MTHITTQANIENDPKFGFAHFGEYAIAVATAQVARRKGQQSTDDRLLPLAAAPSVIGNEGSGADGGLLVPPGFGSEIFGLSLDEDSFLPLTDDMPIAGNSMLLPKDETTPWGTNGIRAYWAGEGAAGTPTKPVLTGMDLRLKKLISIVPVSNELMDDGLAISGFLTKKISSSVQWKTNDAILYGSGAGLPLGAITAGATVVVAKDPGQATQTLSVSNLATMIARLMPGSFKRSVWLASPECFPALITLTLGNFPMWLPAGAGAGAVADSPYGSLFGRPLMLTQHAKAFSTQGDVALVDFSYYQSISKAGGAQTATSMHLYFDADALAFRMTFRIDGQPKLTKPVTSFTGTSQLAPTVLLGAR